MPALAYDASATMYSHCCALDEVFLDFRRVAGVGVVVSLMMGSLQDAAVALIDTKRRILAKTGWFWSWSNQAQADL